eukprot:6208039-Pleurochrysis_carterae.AAC.2
MTSIPRGQIPLEAAKYVASSHEAAALEQGRVHTRAVRLAPVHGVRVVALAWIVHLRTKKRENIESSRGRKAGKLSKQLQENYAVNAKINCKRRHEKN